ncbi:MAG: serine hydrolase [Bacteroidota bacterium]|nr:serine hydrolase [Bacteroidota bacterium]MDP4235822.1 serine hydrolase [Bacteroidota bacterium]
MTKPVSYSLLAAFLAAFSILALPLATQAQLRSTTLRPQAPVEIHLPSGQAGNLSVASIDSTLGDRIIEAMNALYGKTLDFNKHGVSASISVPGLPQWSGAIGVSYAATPMDTNLLCEAGSITKTFVTALIMQLQDEGKLSIKDSIYKWLPKKYPNVDSAITIEMLLNHSSGIYDYVNDDTDQTVLYDQYESDPTKVWTADEILMNYVFAPNFAPGKGYQYSNTNFILLALIAERVGGASARDQIHARFIDALHMTKTFYGGVDSITMPFAHNWSPADSKYPATDLSFINKTAQLTGSPGDGNMCSTPGDLVRWAKALYLGNLVSANGLKEMETTHKWKNGLIYGLGTQYAPYYTHNFYGHSGSMVGFKSSMFANPKDSVCIALFVNWDPDPTITDIYMNDYLVAILNEIYKPTTAGIGAKQLPDPSVSVYPNPAGAIATFAFSLDASSTVSLSMRNELGAEVLNSAIGTFDSGIHSVSVELSKLHPGMYFYSLQTSSRILTGKVLIQ